MIFDLQEGDGPQRLDFDACVIGTGAAGITCAIELVRRGKRVLLLESGGTNIENRTQALYRGDADGLRFCGLEEGRARILGGTTTEWGGQIMELDEDDFHPKSWVPGSGWPFEKSTLQPYYVRALELEGLRACELDDDRVWESSGTPRPDFARDLTAKFSRWCPQPNFAKLHRQALAENSNLSVVLHANVCRFVLSDDMASVQAVVCRSLNGAEAVFAARAFVLCMGAIETVRFLMQPLAKLGEPPWNRSGLLGCHFQDHISCFVANVSQIRLSPAEAYFDYKFVDGYKYLLKICLKPELQKQLKTLNVGATVSRVARNEDVIASSFRTYRMLRRRKFANISPSDFLQFLSAAPALLWHVLPYKATPLGVLGQSRAAWRLCIHCEQSPASTSRITLTDEIDALGLRRARILWQTCDLERHSIRLFLNRLRSVFADQGIATIEADPEISVEGEALTAKFRESFHHIGGTRMANSETSGVVDPNLRVFGTHNLYVCSSSVFPTGGIANPTHTIIALAARLAEHLVQTRLMPVVANAPSDAVSP